MGKHHSDEKSSKKGIKIFLIILLLIIIGIGAFLGWKYANSKKTIEVNTNIAEQAPEENTQEPEPEKTIQIFKGTDRPIACMIDNHSDAWPQFSISKAYTVYEIIVEGGETRLMAVFKGADADKVGPMRSSRHYFLDYALENDAIYAHIGWSPQAQSDIKKLGMKHSDLFKPEWVQIALDRYKYNSVDDMYASIGFGAISATKIIARLLEEYRKEHKEEDLEKTISELANKKTLTKPSRTGVIVEGIDNCLVKLSKCCNPLPGDQIVGYITKGRGVSVHRADCVNVKDLLSDEGRMIDVYWANEAKTTYSVEVTVYANDRQGLLADVIKAITGAKFNILGVNTKTTKERIAIIDMTIELENLEELNKVIRVLRGVDSVYDVKRNK